MGGGDGGFGGESSVGGGGRTVGGGGQGGAEGGGGQGGGVSCGDGVVEGTEGCDDGNTANGDGCDSACAVETGWTCCIEPLCNGQTCEPICGDGIVLGDEECDDANQAVGDGCDDTCAEESGFTCTGSPSACTVDGSDCPAAIEAVDGFVYSGSDIAQYGDDLNFEAFPGCVDSAGTASTSPEIVFSIDLVAGQRLVSRNFGTEDLLWQLTNACAEQVCLASFDGEVGDTEQTAGLDFVATATDTYYVFVESSSDANDLDPIATFEIHFDVSECGDGIVGVGESCDDGDTMGGDGCSTNCATESGFLCSGEPSTCQDGASCTDPVLVSLPAAFLGTDWPAFNDDEQFTDTSCKPVSTETWTGYDMVFRVDLEVGEILRVRELSSTDTVFHILQPGSCTATTPCITSTDFNESTGITYSATASGPVNVAVEFYGVGFGNEPVSLPYHVVLDSSRCRNGVIEFAETCDEGAIDDVGCSPSCLIESGYDCAQEPSACTTCETSSAIDVSSTPFQLTGTIDSYGDDQSFELEGGCSYPGAGAGNDIVFRLDLLENETVRLRETAATFDAILRILAPQECGTGKTCAADVDGEAADESDGITYTATADGPVYLVVENKDAASLTAPFAIGIDGWRCGDGIVEETESCDDTGNVDGDGCSSVCEVEAGWACDIGALGSSVCFDVSGCATALCYLGPCVGGTIATGPANEVLPVAIPDDQPSGGALLSVTLGQPGTVRKVAAAWTVSHTFGGDLDFYLVGPDSGGIERDVCSDNGGSDDNFSNTIVRDGVTTSIRAGAAPFTGIFRPETPLSTFAPEGAQGDWTLRVADDFLGDVGQVTAFEIAVCVDP